MISDQYTKVMYMKHNHNGCVTTAHADGNTAVTPSCQTPQHASPAWLLKGFDTFPFFRSVCLLIICIIKTLDTNILQIFSIFMK